VIVKYAYRSEVYLRKLQISFANRLVVKLYSSLLNIKLSLTEFTVYNLPGPFKHLVTIEWEDRDSRNGSSRSRALVGLSRAFRTSLVSAVKSCSVRTSECASTPRCFKPPVLPSLTQRLRPSPDATHRFATSPKSTPPLAPLRVICSFDSFPMSTQFPRAIGDLV